MTIQRDYLAIAELTIRKTLSILKTLVLHSNNPAEPPDDRNSRNVDIYKEQLEKWKTDIREQVINETREKFELLEQKLEKSDQQVTQLASHYLIMQFK